MRRIIDWFKKVRAWVILCRVNKLENDILINKKEVEAITECIKYLKKGQRYFEKEIRQVSEELTAGGWTKNEIKKKRKFLARGKKYLERLLPHLHKAEKDRIYHQKRIEELRIIVRKKYHGLDKERTPGYTQSGYLQKPNKEVGRCQQNNLA